MRKDRKSNRFFRGKNRLELVTRRKTLSYCLATRDLLLTYFYLSFEPIILYTWHWRDILFTLFSYHRDFSLTLNYYLLNWIDKILFFCRINSLDNVWQWTNRSDCRPWNKSDQLCVYVNVGAPSAQRSIDWNQRNDKISFGRIQSRIKGPGSAEID